MDASYFFKSEYNIARNYSDLTHLYRMDLPTLINRASTFPVLGVFKFFLFVDLFVLGGGDLQILIEGSARKQ